MLHRADHKQTMGFAARLRRRLACERGYSLIELLVVILLLSLVLGAIVDTSVNSRRAATRDTERSLTTAAANAAIYRMANLIRQARLVHLSDTSCPNGSAPANCIDFNLPGRTVITRDGDGNVTGISRPTWRVRINCSTGACVQATNTTGTSPPTSPVSTLITGVQNSAITTPGGQVRPIFDYKVFDASTTPGPWKSATLAFNMTNLGADASTKVPWIQVTLQVARRGTRRTGLGGNIYLQDAAQLRNIRAYDTTPCSLLATGNQAFC